MIRTGPGRARAAALGAALALSAALVSASPALAVSGEGILSQFPGAPGCFSEVPLAGCADSDHLSHAADVVVSADGKFAYVASYESSSVTGYTLDPATASFGHRVTCWSQVAAAGCVKGDALDGARGLAIAPDGKTLYVASAYHSLDNGGVAALARDPATGVLTAQRNCRTRQATAVCPQAVGLEGAQNVAVAPSGNAVYVTAYYGGSGTQTGGALTAYSILPSGALGTQISCRTAASIAVAGCTHDDIPFHPSGLTVAPDGNTVFMTIRAGNAYHGGVAGYKPAADGSLSSATTCFAEIPTLPCIEDASGITDATDVAVSADNARIYVSALEGGGSVAAFSRNLSTGRIDAELGCLDADQSDGCRRAAGLTNAFGVAVGPDGQAAYVAAGNGLAAFATDPLTGFDEEIGCWTEPVVAGCGRAHGVTTGTGVAVRPDNRAVYMAAQMTGTGGAVSAFRRELAPACFSATQKVGAGTPTRLVLPCSDPNGDAVTRIVTPPRHGTLSTSDRSAATVMYRGDGRYRGTDVVRFEGSDGATRSGVAQITLQVVADGAPRSRIGRLPRAVSRRRARRVTGTASDDFGVTRVELAVVTRRGSACLALTSSGRLRASRPARGGCPKLWLRTRGTTAWSIRLRAGLPAGSYTLYSRATDTAGRHEARFTRSRGNRAVVRLR
jgi:DNA-binding beta-propeller fold protein YncE